MTAIYHEIDWTGIGAAVRDRRSASGLTPEQAAQKLCLSKKQILALESGSSAPFPGASVRSWCGRRYAVLLGLDWEHLVQPPPGEDQAVATEDIPASARPMEPEAARATASETAPASRHRAHPLLGWAVLLLVAVIGIGMAATDASVGVSAPAANIAPKADFPVAVPASEAAAADEQYAAPVDHQVSAKEETALAVSPAQNTSQAQTPPTPASAPAPAKAAPETVVEIQGLDAAKQTGSFFVSSKEQAALLKKARNDAGAGVRIDLPQGAARRIPIAENEIVRVAEGRNLGLFYQGRMVPARVVESGAWVKFVRKTADTGD